MVNADNTCSYFTLNNAKRLYLSNGNYLSCWGWICEFFKEFQIFYYQMYLARFPFLWIIIQQFFSQLSVDFWKFLCNIKETVLVESRPRGLVSTRTDRLVMHYSREVLSKQEGIITSQPSRRQLQVKSENVVNAKCVEIRSEKTPATFHTFGGLPPFRFWFVIHTAYAALQLFGL